MVEENNIAASRTNMLLVAMCVMMKILEYSSGTVLDVHAPTQEEIRPRRQRKKRKRRPKRGKCSFCTGIFKVENVFCRFYTDV